MANTFWTTIGSFLATAAFIYWTFIKRTRKIRDISNKVVLITGASSGLGEACAHAFYKVGACVILSARRREELERVKQSLMKLKLTEPTHEPKILILDLSDSASIAAKVQEALAFHGHIDILINNGGISYRGEIEETSLDVDRRVMEVNYFGQVAITKAVLPHMKQRHSGHIVAVSSIQGKISIPFRSCYSASKHALQAFCDCLRAEVEQEGIRVTVVSPGYVRTNLSLSAVTADGSIYAQMDETTASGMSPEYVAQRILQAVIHDHKDVLLGAFTHKHAVILKNLLPNVFSLIMAKRAKKQRREMKKNT